MQPQGGLLIAAILVLAIATGCRRDDKSDQTRKSPPRQAAPAGPSQFAMHDVPDRAPTTKPAPTTRPSLGRATDELDEIGQEALKLRRALLHANFRSFGPADDATENDEEADDDSR